MFLFSVQGAQTLRSGGRGASFREINLVRPYTKGRYAAGRYAASLGQEGRYAASKPIS